MFRLATVVALQIALLSVTLEPTRPVEYGTADKAKAMLERAVAAVKEDKAKALDMFNKGEAGFEDRDLYVFCANTSDGILTAHPYLKGEHLQDVEGKKGYPLGKEIMQNATEGAMKRAYLLVAPSWVRQAVGEDHLLHEGRRSRLRCRLLQGITCAARVTVYGTERTFAFVAIKSALTQSGHQPRNFNVDFLVLSPAIRKSTR